MEGKTATEVEDTARHTGEVMIHCLRWNVCEHEKCADLEEHDDNYVCDFCKCEV
jgi:hypothetical protein